MLPLPPEQWAERTFGCADLGDKRRTKRLVHTAVDLSAHTMMDPINWTGS